MQLRPSIWLEETNGPNQQVIIGRTDSNVIRVIDRCQKERCSFVMRRTLNGSSINEGYLQTTFHSLGGEKKIVKRVKQMNRCWQSFESKDH